MKVILLKDVPSVGRTGDVKEVADGYARNFLLPKGVAAVATAGGLQKIEILKKTQQRHEAKTESEIRDLAKRLELSNVIILAKVGEGERLYGSITNADIAERLSDLTRSEIDKRKVELDEPIKQIGTHEVTVRLSPTVQAKVKVVVEVAKKGL